MITVTADKDSQTVYYPKKYVNRSTYDCKKWQMDNLLTAWYDDWTEYKHQKLRTNCKLMAVYDNSIVYNRQKFQICHDYQPEMTTRHFVQYLVCPFT